MSNNSLTDLHQLVWTSLMAATIAAGAYVMVPLGPVPFSMQTFFVALTGLVLGPKRGAMAVGLYLLAGTLGLPVFAGGKSGLGHLLGPTGGFLMGFVAFAVLCGLARVGETVIPWVKGLVFGFLGMAALFILGAVWLKFSLSLTWSRTWDAAVLPFLFWGSIKIVSALLCARYLSKYNLLPGQR